ncbi:MAG: hypothetical protein ACOX3I_02720 [Limnochordia bacterium]|jgi:hypothetical protein
MGRRGRHRRISRCFTDLLDDNLLLLVLIVLLAFLLILVLI